MKIRSLLVSAGLITLAATSGCATQPVRHQPANGAMQEVALMPIRRVAPIYPTAAIDKNAEGLVKVCFTVNKDGSVHDVRVEETKLNLKNSFIKHDIESATVDAIEQWRFEPQRVNGKPINTPDVCQDLRFKL